jgi:hypothetical protein
MVPEIITGQRRPASSKNFSMANSAALALSVSNTVFHQQDVGAAGGQAARGFDVIGHQRVEGDVARAGVIDVGRERGGARGRPQHAGDEARFVGCGKAVSGFARQPRGGHVQLVGKFLQPVLGLRHPCRVEAVGLDDVGAGREVLGVDAADHVRSRDAQQVVVALEVLAVRRKALSAIIRLDQAVALHHGAHGAVENEDALRQQCAQFGAAVGLPAGGGIGGYGGHASLQSMTGAGALQRLTGGPEGSVSAVETGSEPGVTARISGSALQRSSEARRDYTAVAPAPTFAGGVSTASCRFPPASRA